MEPPVKIATPEVLRRVKTEMGGALRFSSGIMIPPFTLTWFSLKNLQNRNRKKKEPKREQPDKDKEESSRIN